MRAPEALLIDPYQPYAELYISRLFRDYGIRTVALHRRWRSRLVLEPRSRVLRSSAVSANYMIPEAGIEALAPMLRERHSVVAVLPHDEGAVWPLARLAELLDLSWSQPQVLRLFASKGSLKRRLVERASDLRLNQTAAVAGPADVRRWIATTGVNRFVLKPDDGSGNRGVAFFDDDVSDDQLANYFAEVGGGILAEEFIGGEEYWVNGQIDAAGTPVVTMIGRYDRGEVNGKENVELSARTLPSTAGEFRALHDYAVDVMRTIGLRRSPFHLEAKIDARGPCLIEVGARLCGDLLVLADQWQHGPRVDLIDAAIHDYVTDAPRPPLELDWERADAHPVAQVNGVSESHMVVGRVEGVAAVEQLPGFLFWVKAPAVGDVVAPTLDLIAKPWGACVWAPTYEELDARETVVRELIRLTPRSELEGGVRAHLPVLRNRLQRYWSARPRPYMARALRTRV